MAVNEVRRGSTPNRARAVISGATALAGVVALGYTAYKYGWSFSSSTAPEATWAVAGAAAGGAIGYTVAENNLRYGETAANATFNKDINAVVVEDDETLLSCVLGDHEDDREESTAIIDLRLDSEPPTELFAVVSPAHEVVTVPQPRPLVPMELAQHLVFYGGGQGVGRHHAA
jgi:hypothetical protein